MPLPKPHAPRIAIVSDPLVQRGGAERCVEALAEAFPEAPIYAILYSSQTGPESIGPRVAESWLGRIPGARRHHRLLWPLFPPAVEAFDLKDFDIVISSHHTAAKGILRTANQCHICYCYTPMRALWERSHEELETLPKRLRGLAASLFRRMRIWDYATAARVDVFVAISSTTRRRIAKHYRRDSIVICPPIDVEKFTPAGEAQDYYLVIARRVPYKRVDIAIAATRIAGRRLIVVGDGWAPTKRGGQNVEYLGNVSDEHLLGLMRGARALIAPQHEDFGMALLEIMACGRPVIAYAKGGALDTVVDGVTGILVAEQTAQAFADAIRRLEVLEFSTQRLRHHAERFSKPKFRDAMMALVQGEYERLQASMLPSPQ